MTPLIAVTLVAVLVGAQTPNAGPSLAGAPDGGAPNDPDADVIENLDLLEELDLIDNLDIMEPKAADASDPPRGDAPPPR